MKPFHLYFCGFFNSKSWPAVFFFGPHGAQIWAPDFGAQNLGAAPKFGLRENLGEAQKNQRKKFCKVKMRSEHSVF